MADRDLQVINSSGELTEIKIGGVTDGEKVLTSDEVAAKFGNYTFDGDNMELNADVVLSWEDQAGAYSELILKNFNSSLKLSDGIINKLIELRYNIDVDNYTILELRDTYLNLGCIKDGVSTYIQVSEKEIIVNYTIADINLAPTNSLVTKEWVETKVYTQAAPQADSTATSVGALKRDFNDLLAKLRAAGLMET